MSKTRPSLDGATEPQNLSSLSLHVVACPSKYQAGGRDTAYFLTAIPNRLSSPACQKVLEILSITLFLCALVPLWLRVNYAKQTQSQNR